MKFYVKYLLIFLRAALISLLFGASWVVTFYGFDQYASAYLQKFRNDFFFDVVLFFLSGLVGAFLFYLIMCLLRKVNSSVAN